MSDALLRIEAEADAERRAQLERIAREHEVSRRDTARERERKADRSAEAAALALMALMRWTRTRAQGAALMIGLREADRMGVRPAVLPIPSRAPTLLLEQAVRDYERAVRERAKYLLSKSKTPPRALLTRAFEETTERALRITATETWSVASHELGKVQRAAGVLDLSLVREWVAELDKRTCERCAARDGEQVPARERFSPEPPLHPLCRCTTELRRP